MMKLLVILLFHSLILIPGTDKKLSVADKDDRLRTYYYSTVEFVETPLSQIKGSVGLSQREALSRNHYRFAYNDKHQLVSISFFNGNTPREPNHTANLFTLSHRMEFSYGKEVEKITFYDKNKVQIPVLGDCYSFVYTYNSLGLRNRLHFLDKHEKPIVNSWGIYEYIWEYQADGSVIETRFDDQKEPVTIRPGFEFYRLRLRFDPLGHISLMQNIDEDGNLIENSSGASQDRIKTNAHGHFLEWNVLNNRDELEKGNGPDVAIGRQEYNEFGYETSLAHFDENGQSIASHYGIIKSKTSFAASNKLS